MAFLSKCAIHASSPRIWRKLISLGLHPDPCALTMKERNFGNHICTVVVYDVFFNVPECNIDSETHDCVYNEDLFFALAALRDDSDLNQWFIYDNRDWNDDDRARFWFVCKQECIEDDMACNQMFVDCEKAKKQELIQHFSGDDDDEVVDNL